MQSPAAALRRARVAGICDGLVARGALTAGGLRSFARPLLAPPLRPHELLRRLSAPRVRFGSAGRTGRRVVGRRGVVRTSRDRKARVRRAVTWTLADACSRTDSIDRTARDGFHSRYAGGFSKSRGICNHRTASIDSLSPGKSVKVVARSPLPHRLPLSLLALFPLALLASHLLRYPTNTDTHTLTHAHRSRYTPPRSVPFRSEVLAPLLNTQHVNSSVRSHGKA